MYTCFKKLLENIQIKKNVKAKDKVLLRSTHRSYDNR